MSVAPGSRQDGGVWVAVPFKGPVGGKRRLAGLLDASERARLSLAMLDGVLEAALGTSRVARVLVMLPAPVAQSWYPEHADARLTFVTETPREQAADPAGSVVDGLNCALVQAQAVADAAEASRLLILPSDLPLIGAGDVDALVAAASHAPVVISPDRAAEGTNALLLSPPAALVPSFGEASFERHRQLAQAAGLDTAVVRRWGLALDLDTPADVLRLLAIGQECRAARLLQELEIAGRLARLGVAEPTPSGT